MKKFFPTQSYRGGFTLIEVVVAIGVFAVLSIITSLLLVGALRGSKKAAASILVRGQGAYAIESMASQIRFAKSIVDCTAGNSISVKTQTDVNLTFACLQSGSDTYLASNSARLTSNTVQVVTCANVFTCPSPESVHINFSLQRGTTGQPLEGTAKIDFDTEVVLRNN